MDATAPDTDADPAAYLLAALIERGIDPADIPDDELESMLAEMGGDDGDLVELTPADDYPGEDDQ